MTDNKFSLPIHWNDHEDIAIELYEKFGDAFDESKIYRNPFYRSFRVGAYPSQFCRHPRTIK